jgi:predicted  nucleic acid-binding Zn-ribbon protein
MNIYQKYLEEFKMTNELKTLLILGKLRKQQTEIRREIEKYRKLLYNTTKDLNDLLDKL